MLGGRNQLAAAAIVGLSAGFLSGLFGVGGGILIVPGLVLAMRMDQRVAHGTSLAAIIAIAPLGVAGFAIHDKVDWTAAGLISVGAVAGAIAGTALLHRVSQPTLRIAFAIFLIASGIRLMVALPAAHGRGEIDALMALGLVVLGLVSGTTAGLLGVGGGIVIIPMLVILLSMPDAVAKGTSLVVIIPTAIVGTWRNIRKGNTNLRVAGVVGLVGAGAAFAGSQLAVNIDPDVSKVLFSILLFVVAAQLLLQRARRPATAPGTD
jgi:uncharacterized protein